VWLPIKQDDVIRVTQEKGKQLKVVVKVYNSNAADFNGRDRASIDSQMKSSASSFDWDQDFHLYLLENKSKCHENYELISKEVEMSPEVQKFIFSSFFFFFD